MISVAQAVDRVLREKHPIRFLISRILLRSRIDLPIILTFDTALNVRTYLHASSAAHKLFVGRYAPHLDIAVFRKYITRTNAVVYDIGANIGMFSVIAAKLAPQGMVYAFEATARSFQYLLDNSKLNAANNIYPVFAAVTDTEGIVSFFEHKNSHEQNYIDATGKSGVSVPALRLDSFAALRNVSSVDFMKVDVEGAEFSVFRSLGDHLKKVKVIYFEVTKSNSERFGYTEAEIIDFLRNEGYSVYVPQLEDGELRIDRYQPSLAKGLNLIAIRE